jgi:hypothetical protein
VGDLEWHHVLGLRAGFWQARWTVDRDPKKQITLKEVDRNKNLSLPSKPRYPPSARP